MPGSLEFRESLCSVVSPFKTGSDRSGQRPGAGLNRLQCKRKRRRGRRGADLGRTSQKRTAVSECPRTAADDRVGTFNVTGGRSSEVAFGEKTGISNEPWGSLGSRTE